MKKSPILLVLCGGVLALATGCAAPGAPLPPSLRLPMAVNNLSAVRKGERVVLTWPPPTETTDRLPIRWPSTTRICRVVNQFPISQCSEIVTQIESSELASVAPASRRPLVSFEDVLPASLIDPQNQATYAIEVVNPRGRSAGLSNQVLIPLAPTAPPPAGLRATLDAQGPRLHWEMESGLAPSPGISCLLRIYRRASAAGAAPVAAHPPSAAPGEFAVVAEQPCRPGPGEARDNSFEWERGYDYKAVAVTVIATAGRPLAEVEGDDSNLVHLETHDIFPPAVPSGLQAVYSSVEEKPFIDLTWAPDTEPDLAGYIVYRRTAGTGFAVVTPAPVKAPAWRDRDVQPGQTYTYTVTAIDGRGNQSAQSAPASESVPQEVQ